MNTGESTSNWMTPPTGTSGLFKRFRRVMRRRRHRDLASRGWYALSARSNADAIFIGGCGRSGTTVFREMLGRHPRLACGPETSLFGLPFDVSNISAFWDIDPNELQRKADTCSNLIEFADWFYLEHLLKVEGKKRWVDKTPNNVRVISKLLTWFPNGRFIHVIRDGRDVVCSLRHHPSEKVIDGKLTPVQSNNPINRCALRWLNDTCAGLAFASHPRCLAVRYEDVVADPEREFRRICDFIGESFDSGMLDTARTSTILARSGSMLNNRNAAQPVSRRSQGRWRRDLSADERRQFVNIAGELLVALGYSTGHSWVDEWDEADSIQAPSAPGS